jgi:hypothetical protein
MKTKYKPPKFDAKVFDKGMDLYHAKKKERHERLIKSIVNPDSGAPVKPGTNSERNIVRRGAKRI